MLQFEKYNEYNNKKYASLCLAMQQEVKMSQLFTSDFKLELIYSGNNLYFHVMQQQNATNSSGIYDRQIHIIIKVGTKL